MNLQQQCVLYTAIHHHILNTFMHVKLEFHLFWSNVHRDFALLLQNGNFGFSLELGISCN
jgi:hypothetical protein